jgi:pyruvate dehydrogenase E2 component (dihydrolipoamide acetyltransferase)
MADVSMPRLSDSMEEGTILKWLKSDGDEVSKGDELVEIETDKANMTYEADQAGTLEIVAKEGDTLPVGETIARIGEGGGGDGAATEEDEQPEAQEPEDDEEEKKEPEDGQEEPEGDEEQAEPEGEEEPEEDEEEREPEPEPARAKSGDDDDGGANGRVKASPVARRMAREMGLELAGVQGTGPGGRIVKADVEAAAREGGAQAEEEREEAPAEAEAPDHESAREEKAPAPVASGDGQTGRGEVTHQDLTRLQQTVARRMAESKATAPDFVITVEVDMDAAVEFRKQLKVAAGDDPAPSFNDFVIKASALALRDFPRANAAYRDGRFELYERVNVGVAVAGQDALVVPTLFDADRKGLGTIARESRAVAERVRKGAITPPELSAGTFTVSNLGMYGIKRFVAVINPPQAAILAVGEMTPRPVVRDGEVKVSSVLELTLSCDHRILYGADAAQFLARIREYLENPLRLAL